MRGTKRLLSSPAFLLGFLHITLRWLWSDVLIQSSHDEPSISSSVSLLETNPSYFNCENYEVVTTNYGWNTPDAHKFSRRILTGEFFNATLAHHCYNASAWGDLEKNPDPARKIVAFMDIDTCIELNYPVYGRKDWWMNLEIRNDGDGYRSVVFQSCSYINRAAKSPALLANPDSRLVILDCSGNARNYLQKVCQDESFLENDQVIMAYMSALKRSARSQDVGLPPPAIKPADLSAWERYQVTLCDKRKYLYSFQGQKHKKFLESRNKLLLLKKYEDMYINMRHQKRYASEIRQGGIDSNNYTDIMKQSTFGGAPKGDNLFSYRFAEVLSAGAIPVVYADGWLPPFNEKVVNWTQCIVFIAESVYENTRDILLTIHESIRCQMQKCALEIWDKYVSSRAGWVRGLVEVAISDDSNLTGRRMV